MTTVTPPVSPGQEHDIPPLPEPEVDMLQPVQEVPAPDLPAPSLDDVPRTPAVEQVSERYVPQPDWALWCEATVDAMEAEILAREVPEDPIPVDRHYIWGQVAAMPWPEVEIPAPLVFAEDEPIAAQVWSELFPVRRVERIEVSRDEVA